MTFILSNYKLVAMGHPWALCNVLMLHVFICSDSTGASNVTIVSFRGVNDSMNISPKVTPKSTEQRTTSAGNRI